VRLSRSRVALLGILAAAAVLRLILPGPHPDTFQPDEVVNGYDAFCLARQGTDHHGNRWPLLFESYGDWVSPLLTYVTVPFVALGGLSEVTIRLPGIVANVLAAGAVALLTFELTGARRAALFAAALLALSPWDIALAQWAAAPTLLPLLTALSALFALRTIRTRGLPDALGFAVYAALLVYDYPTQKLFGPLLVVIAASCFRGWRERAIAAVAFAAATLPIDLLTFSDPKYNARFAYVGLDPHDPAFAANVLQRYAEYLNPAFLFGRGDMSFAPVLGPFFALGFAALLVALAAPETMRGIGRRAAAFIALALVLAPLPASLTIDHLHLNRVAHVLPLVPAVTAIGTLVLFRLLGSTTLQRLAAIVIAVQLEASTVPFARAYYGGRHVETGFAEEQVGLGDAIATVVRRFPRAAIVVDTSAFNQPALYYLFAVRYDCAKLPLDQMRRSQADGIVWAYVSAVDAIRFRPVGADERARSTPLAELDEAGTVYAVRGGNGNVYVTR
jgi:hypothetical protein